MAVAQGRVGDLWVGICFCHEEPIATTGVIITGGIGQESKNNSVSRITNLVQAHCGDGHIGIIVTGSGKSFTNNLGKAVVGSITTGCATGVIVEGAPNHLTG